MTVGIDFWIVDADGEVIYDEKYVKFDERLHGYLRNKEKKFGKTFDLLLDLDPYGDRLFSGQEINELKNICEVLSSKYGKDDKQEQEIRRFARELKGLCQKALEQDKLVSALGD